jgi:acyl transferase domain-containing protein
VSADRPANDYRTLLARALDRIEELERPGHRPVSILGAGVRLPGNVGSIEEASTFLHSRRDAVGPARQDDTMRRGFLEFGALEDPLGFDAEFFGISDVEAQRMDPQQRLALETTWEALFDAGIAPTALAGGDTGVFVGAYAADWMLMQAQRPDDVDAYSGPGSAHSILANRVSYLLDLHGPSMTVDTACSSSLTALHLAVTALRSGQCTTAIVIGVHVVLADFAERLTRGALPFSTTDRCRSFDAQADGIVRGEGCVALVLRIEGVTQPALTPRGTILGIAINHGGRANGLTAPNPTAQEAVLRAALRDSGRSSVEIGYIEAHGTGTSLGDPIELSALDAVYGRGHTQCIVGSLKSSVGHLEAVAGLAGVIKALGVIDNRLVPQQLHFDRLNPEIDLSRSRLTIAAEHLPTDIDAPLAAVSAFGFGGSNAHVILAAPITELPTPRSSGAEVGLLLPVSAHDVQALSTLRERYIRLLERASPDDAMDIARNAALRHGSMRYRSAWTGDDLHELRHSLQTDDINVDVPGPSTKPVFVYSGQGAAWQGMGAGLYEYPALVEILEQWEQEVALACGWSVRQALSSTRSDFSQSAEKSQICTAVVQLAITTLLSEWGVTPTAVVGHSMGEVVAAVTAGLLDTAQAFTLLAARAREQEDHVKGGAMVAARCDLHVAEAIVASIPGTAVAAVNSPHAIVFSGSAASMDVLVGVLDDLGLKNRNLLTGYAFHGAQLKDGELRHVPQALRTRGAVTLFSTVTGLADPHLDAEHWNRNLKDRVEFQNAILACEQTLGNSAQFIEIGPDAVLVGAVDETLIDAGSSGDSRRTALSATLLRDRPASEALRNVVAGLFSAGIDVDLTRAVGVAGRRMQVPRYPWTRTKREAPAPTAIANNRSSCSLRSSVSRDDLVAFLTVEIETACTGNPVVEPMTAVKELEIESLQLVRIRSRLQRALDIDAPLTVLLSGASIETMASQILGKSRTPVGEQDLDDLTTEELEQLMRNLDGTEGASA